MIKKAIEFATKAHEGQFRKGTTRPYIVHPLEVGEIAKLLTEDEDIICAAYLHDTVEDCENVTLEMLEKEFSPRIAFIVSQESEDKSKTWMERKTYTIEHLKDTSDEVRILALSDKLSNIRDIDREYPMAGEEIWNRFRMRDKHVIGWYYKGIRDALEPYFKESPVYIEYCSLVAKYFEE